MTGVPLNIDWQQILLHLFNFTILFAILYFLLYKPVKEFMNKRVAYYKDIDDKVAKKLEEAEQIKSEYELKIQKVDEEIRQEKERVRTDLEKASARRIKDATNEASRIMTKAKEEAEIEKSKIINSAQAEISTMVAIATEKLALKATTSEAYDQFLDATERDEDNE